MSGRHSSDFASKYHYTPSISSGTPYTPSLSTVYHPPPTAPKKQQKSTKKTKYTSLPINFDKIRERDPERAKLMFDQNMERLKMEKAQIAIAMKKAQEEKEMAMQKAQQPKRIEIKKENQNIMPKLERISDLKSLNIKTEDNTNKNINFNNFYNSRNINNSNWNENSNINNNNNNNTANSGNNRVFGHSEPSISCSLSNFHSISVGSYNKEELASESSITSNNSVNNNHQKYRYNSFNGGLGYNYPRNNNNNSFINNNHNSSHCTEFTSHRPVSQNSILSRNTNKSVIQRPNNNSNGSVITQRPHTQGGKLSNSNNNNHRTQAPQASSLRNNNNNNNNYGNRINWNYILNNIFVILVLIIMGVVCCTVAYSDAGASSKTWIAIAFAICSIIYVMKMNKDN